MRLSPGFTLYQMASNVLAVSDDEGKTFHYLYDFSGKPDMKFMNVAIAHVHG